MKKAYCISTLLFIILTGTALAGVPGTVNYQGYLTDDQGYPITGAYDMTFIMTETAQSSTRLWDETWNSGTSQVVVVDGYYSVLLGTYTSFGTLFDDYDTLYLDISIDGEQLSPRKPIATSGYSQRAANADTLDGADSTDFYKKTDSVDADTLDGQDSTAFAGASHSHSFSEITGSVTDAQVPNNITINYAASAGAVPWSGITGMPSGFSDGTDNEGVTTEVDPTVLASVKDGVSFAELSGTATDAQIPDTISIDYATGAGSVPWSGITSMPAGFADDTDDTGLVGTAITSVPITISTPGYYYLESNLTLSTSSAKAITVSTDNVTIDLKGFVLSGLGTTSSTGIYSNGYDNFEVRNGTITAFHHYGINENSSAGSDHRIINVRITENGISGIHMYGNNHSVVNCTVSGNGYDGIWVSYGAKVIGNNVFNNDYRGIFLAEQCVASKNVVYSNVNDGIYGSNNGNVIAENSVFDNGDDGIYTGSTAVVYKNTVHNSTDNGIEAGVGCTVAYNSSGSNGGYGIYVNVGSNVVGNSAYNNSETGIFSFHGSTIKGNTVRNSGWHGILTYGNCLIKDNTSTSNQRHGIDPDTYCLVENNVAYDNNKSGGSYTNIHTCGTCTFGTNVQ